MSYFAVVCPKKVDAKVCLIALKVARTDLEFKLLIPNRQNVDRVGTDDVSANVAAGGLKGLEEKEV